MAHLGLDRRYPDEGYRHYRNSIWLTLSPSYRSHGSVSGSVAAGQNSELCHKLTALQNGFLHIDILIVIVFPLVLALVPKLQKFWSMP